MKRLGLAVLGLSVVALLLFGSGCGSKKTAAGTEMDPTKGEGASTIIEPGSAPGTWAYDQPASPAFQGAPEMRLTSFAFDQGSAEMKPEGMGACREAIRKIQDQPAAKILAVGFAEAINEKETGDKIALRRAESARAFLSTLGVTADRVQVTSFGTQYSTAQGFEKIKQAHERKVELWLLK